MELNFTSIAKSSDYSSNQPNLPPSKVNNAVNKQKAFRPPLHSYNLFEPKPDKATVIKLHSLMEKNSGKSESQIKLEIIKCGSATQRSSVSATRSQRSKILTEPPKSSRGDNDPVFTTLPVFQGKMIRSRSKSNENKRNRDINAPSKKPVSTEIINNDDAHEAKLLLRKLFTNEKIQSSENRNQFMSGTEETDNKEKVLFQKSILKRQSSEVLSRKYPSMKQVPFRIKNSLTNGKYKIFDENFTKIEIQYGKEMTSEIFKEDTDDLKIKSSRLNMPPQRPKSSQITRSRAVSHRGHTEASEERVIVTRSSSRVIHSDVAKSLVSIGANNIPKRVQTEGEEGSIYLRRRSSGCMYRVRRGSSIKEIIETEGDKDTETFNEKNSINSWYHARKTSIDQDTDTSLKDTTYLESYMKNILSSNNVG